MSKRANSIVVGHRTAAGQSRAWRTSGAKTCCPKASRLCTTGWTAVARLRNDSHCDQIFNSPSQDQSSSSTGPSIPTSTRFLCSHSGHGVTLTARAAPNRFPPNAVTSTNQCSLKQLSGEGHWYDPMEEQVRVRPLLHCGLTDPT